MLNVALMGILQIGGFYYLTLVIGFTVQLSLRDSVLLFVIGIQQFMMISKISSAFSVMRLYGLVLFFWLVMVWRILPINGHE